MNMLPVPYTGLIIGETYQVGEFFWITDGIGYSNDAVHGHGLDRKDVTSPGSADEHCSARLLDIEGNIATLLLIRQEIPYGALAAHGSIFRLPVAVVSGWAGKREEHRLAEKARQSRLASIVNKFGAVVAGALGRKQEDA